MSLKIISYNIQAAIGTKAYSQYLTKFNRQVFNSKAKAKTLKAIAGFASEYDVACLQEVDLGGRRSGFKCQVDYLIRVDAPKPFNVLNVHLSLGEQDQMMQVEYLAAEAPSDLPLIIAGDFNCGSASRPLTELASSLNMTAISTPNDKTYPSWNPRRDFDHMLVSSHFRTQSSGVKDIRHSDHRPFEAFLAH